ncbi:protein of unknown function [Streptomyces murinus]
MVVGFPSPREMEGRYGTALFAATGSGMVRFFAHGQEVAAAGRDAEYVPEGSGQFLRQEAQVLRIRVMVSEGVRGVLQQLGCRSQLDRFDAVRQAGHVAGLVVGAQVAGLAVRAGPRQES